MIVRSRYLVFIALCFLMACSKASTKTAVISETESLPDTLMPIPLSNCIPPITTFAYTVKMDGIKIPATLPPSPWRIETPLPANLLQGNLTIARTINGHSEIWLTVNPYNSFLPEASGAVHQFAIYSSDTKTWEVVSAEVESAEVYVRNLFVFSDGSLWGQNIKDESSDLSGVPLFSKFNEQNKVFEFVKKSKDIPVIQKELVDTPSRWSKVFLDSKDIFWIFAHRDAIYNFNPMTSKTTRLLEISNYVSGVTSAPNGGFYINSGDLFFSSGQLYHYLPETNSMKPLVVRLEPFPAYQSIFLDHKNQLWLDNLGWLEPDGTTWYQIQRSPLFITNTLWSGAEYRWKPGFIEIESTNGILWFSSDNGMISLDPDKGEWCWFTTYQSNIVEDSNRNLWMIADGKLYKLALGK